MKKLTGIVVKTTFAVATLATLGGVLATNALAENTWQKDHPRRVQVNDRVKNQDRRIHNEVKDGQINKAQAHQLRSDDNAIHGEEKAMARQDGGHITRADQTALNQQLNQNSKAIGK